MKALICFATWYGATSDTAEIIAEALRESGIDVEIADLERETVKDISEYDLVVVGTGIRMGRWNREAEKFIDTYRKEFSEKKVAIFASAGGVGIDEKKGDSEKVEGAYKDHLVKKAEKYSLNPVSMGLFGGKFDYTKMGWLTRRLMSIAKKSLKEAGIEEEDGVYDTRDLDKIREWAEELAEKVKK